MDSFEISTTIYSEGFETDVGGSEEKKCDSSQDSSVEKKEQWATTWRCEFLCVCVCVFFCWVFKTESSAQRHRFARFHCSWPMEQVG